MIYMWCGFGKPDPSMMANGMLAGLVAITAPCAFVNRVGGGASSAPSRACSSSGACFFVEGTLKVDDPVGAISVHGVNGAWGVLSLGLFADGDYGDGWNGVPGTRHGPVLRRRASQFVAQCIGTLTCIVFVFRAFYVFFKVVEEIMGNRVSAEDEIEGLDMDEVNAHAYGRDLHGRRSHAGHRSARWGGDGDAAQSARGGRLETSARRLPLLVTGRMSGTRRRRPAMPRRCPMTLQSAITRAAGWGLAICLIAGSAGEATTAYQIPLVPEASPHGSRRRVGCRPQPPRGSPPLAAERSRRGPRRRRARRARRHRVEPSPHVSGAPFVPSSPKSPIASPARCQST